MTELVIGASSFFLLLVFVCSVNLALRYIRLQPFSVYDKQVAWWTAAFVVVTMLLVAAR